MDLIEIMKTVLLKENSMISMNDLMSCILIIWSIYSTFENYFICKLGQLWKKVECNYLQIIFLCFLGG